MDTPLTVLGICGSLRKLSINRGLLRAAQQLTPEGVSLEFFDLLGIPPYNQDDEGKPPGIVTEFKARIRAADAILIATPEYNYSIPGVLDRKSTRLNSSHANISYAVFCLKKQNGKTFATPPWLAVTRSTRRHAPRAPH